MTSKMKLDKKGFILYNLIFDYYRNKSDENLNKILVFWLDNYLDNDPQDLFIIKHLLLLLDFDTMIETVFIGKKIKEDNETEEDED